MPLWVSLAFAVRICVPETEAGREARLTVGAALSMLMPLTVALAELPALSVTVPVTLWLEPSVLTVMGPVTLATPESASFPVKLTVTMLLYHPAALAARSRGGRDRRRRLVDVDAADRVAELPALSVTVPVTLYWYPQC